jgi:hypothetical protein
VPDNIAFEKLARLSDEEHVARIKDARRVLNATIKAAKADGLNVSLDTGSSDGNEPDIVSVFISRHYR